jgi:hypothetical protein
MAVTGDLLAASGTSPKKSLARSGWIDYPIAITATW